MKKLVKSQKLNIKGFTLVELLIVIAIIAILSVTAYVALGGQTSKARDSRRMQDLSAVQNALEIYFINNDSFYPDDLDLLTAKEMPKLPTDPITDAVYAYNTNSTNKRYQLGATLEINPDTGEETYTAYVIGNNDDDILSGVNVPDTTGCGGDSPADGDTDCVPMDIWTK